MAYRVKDYPYNEKLTTEENVLLDRLYKLRMSGMAEILEKQLLDPNAELESFLDRITAIIGYEWDQRHAKKFNKLLKEATLKYPMADLDEVRETLERQISYNMAIAGKTHVGNALCISALHQLHTVKYIRATPLINEALKARDNGNETDYVNRMASYDLLAIDDFGLMELTMDKCRLLFEILETRDCHKATMIISQLPVSKWWDMFVDNTYADACLSRIVHKAHRLEFKGRDMRKPS